MIAPARIAAYDILSAVSSGNADLPTAIAFARASLADDRDRALAAEIATGVQRWCAALDHLIVAFSQRPLDRLDIEVVEILRLSIYQLLHLTRVPASAVVDDAVDLTRRAGKKSASGFVNAVLRTVSRRRRSLPLPPRPTDAGDVNAALDYLSVTLSHPRWLAARWLSRYGFENAERWMRFNNAPAPLTLRANRLRMTRDELAARLGDPEREASAERKSDLDASVERDASLSPSIHIRPTAFAPDGLIVDDGAPLRGPGLDEGWFVVQDEASQLVSLLAAPAPGTVLLDACASPGGKTTAFAAAVGASGRVVACDVRGRRIELLRRTVAACGATNVRIVQADLLHPPPFLRPFDAVVVDAPCSGLGTLRRDPDIRWRRRENDVAALAAVELRMLRHAAHAVAPGGRLVYATCSSEPEENDGVVESFLAETPLFDRENAASAAPELPQSVVDVNGYLRTEPDRHNLEAFFGAVFRRKL